MLIELRGVAGAQLSNRQGGEQDRVRPRAISRAASERELYARELRHQRAAFYRCGVAERNELWNKKSGR